MKINFGRRMNSKGFIFVLDAIMALGIISVVIVFTLHQFPAKVSLTNPEFELASSLVVGMAESDFFSQVIISGSNATVVSVLDELDPHCVHINLRSKTGALLYAIPKTGCTLTIEENSRAFGSFFAGETLYVSEVIVW